jgi:hypothetical protein
MSSRKRGSICGQVKQAAIIVAEIDRGSHYYRMEHDPAYPALFADAKIQAIQDWEDEAVERATVGVFEPTTYRGSKPKPQIFLKSFRFSTAFCDLR